MSQEIPLARARQSYRSGMVAASVVVLSYNSQKTIRASLDSLAAQQSSIPFEVIVVDSSTDATAKIVASEYPWARLIHIARRALPGEARNLGVQHAAGKVIAFLASDCVADRHWLQTRVQLHDAGFAAVGGVITNANPDDIVGWANYFMEYVFCLANRPREVIKGKIIHNLSYHRKVFDHYGLFPVDLPLGEDTVFNRRLMLHEELVVFDPSVRTGHINPSSVKQLMMHHYAHGKYFLRACRNGELSYFRVGAKWGPAIVYQTLVPYPWMRIKNCVRQVAKHNPALMGSLIVCFPILVVGIYSAAIGALVEAIRGVPKRKAPATDSRSASAA